MKGRYFNPPHIRLTYHETLKINCLIYSDSHVPYSHFQADLPNQPVFSPSQYLSINS